MAVTVGENQLGYRGNRKGGIFNPLNYELGISEFVSDRQGLARNSQGGSQVTGALTNYYQPSTNYQTFNNPTTKQITDVANTSRDSGRVPGSVQGAITTGGGNPAPAGLTNTPPTIQNPEQSGEGSLIDSEYASFNQYLNDQENIANTEFSNTEGKINTGLDNAITRLEGDKGLRQGELDAKAESGRQTERLNLQRVRQLLQDLQQRDNARIAITGGGSVNEALADRFARRAQSDIGGVQAEGQRFQNDVLRESERVAQFYDNKKAEITANAQAMINDARLRLESTLSNIRGERNASANAKTHANVNAWRDYYNKINTAKLEAQNLQAQLDIFRQQKDAVLSQSAGFNLADIQGQDVSGVVSGLQDTTSPAIGGDLQANAQLPTNRINIGGQDEDEENQILA